MDKVFSTFDKLLTGKIIELTNSDPKTLPQKILKTQEEIGELSKVALPYQNASGTLHRFIGSQHLLEEVADVFLTLTSVAIHVGVIPTSFKDRWKKEIYECDLAESIISLLTSFAKMSSRLPINQELLSEGRLRDVAYELDECVDKLLSIAVMLDHDQEQLEFMIKLKILKWEEFQLRDSRLPFPLPYELHITVEKADVDIFIAACEVLNVKPVILDLHLEDNKTAKDIMTSSVVIGDNKKALQEVNRISEGLHNYGFRVVREKVETVPWHPAAPRSSSPDSKMPEDCYFECHFNVLCTPDRHELLEIITKAKSAHLSRNAFKKFEDGSYKIMTTIRSYSGNYEEFLERMNNMKETLEAACFHIGKEIVEFSIYDTRVNHDFIWIGNDAA